MKKILICCIIILLSLSAAAETDIVAVNFPLYDLAKHITGDMAGVRMLIAPGTEVHAYDPTPKDRIAVENCDLFLYIGGESEEWVETILTSGDRIPESLRLMDFVDPIEEMEEMHDHEETEYDEHIWTSPVNAIKMADAICEAIIKQDPANAEVYRANADAYVAEIAEVDAMIREIVSGAKRHELIFADRFPLAYFTHEYGLEATAAFPGCSAETEPSAKVMRTLIDAVREEKVPCVYIIELSNGRVAETIREETGCDICMLHSCQNVTKDEMEAGETYVSLMRKNAEALKIGLN